MDEIGRKAMERALKDQCVPTLRQARFKGSFPNFYREDNDFVALVNFQFSLSGGSFCVICPTQTERVETSTLGPRPKSANSASHTRQNGFVWVRKGKGVTIGSHSEERHTVSFAAILFRPQRLPRTSTIY